MADRQSSSLRRKLRGLFLVVAVTSIVVITAFSLLYFRQAIRSDAVSQMRASMNVARQVYENQQETVRFFAENLAADPSLQVLLDLDIRNRVSDYLVGLVQREQVYSIAAFNAKGSLLANVTIDSSPLLLDRESADIGRNPLALQALSGQARSGTERIVTERGTNIIALSAATPVHRNDSLAGAILVRYVLNANPEIVNRVQQTVAVDAAIYESGEALTWSGPHGMDRNLFASLLRVDSTHESGRFWFGEYLVQYSSLVDHAGVPVAILETSRSADSYVLTFGRAIGFFGLLMVVLIVAAIFMANAVSGGIVNPINHLLDGVSRITEGDLSHEIVTSLRDEIGRLSEAFDAMRVSLREKITTIQTMNEGLEATIKERTAQIEDLLEAMRKYLPQQLYDAIVGGSRDTSIEVHYRKKLTVFFSDIVSFTPTTESLEAEDLSALLNSYLDAMAKIAVKWGGTLDKFIGDAVMIFFGDPEFINDKEHALRAVRMAMEMLQKMTELRAQWQETGIQRPLHIRIGINTGYCTIGNFGSENRMDYTIIGKNVNLASRIESAANPDSVFVAYDTYALIRSEIECKPVGQVTLKGIEHPVKVFQVIGEREREQQLDLVTAEPGVLHFKHTTVDLQRLSNQEKTTLHKGLVAAVQYLRKMEASPTARAAGPVEKAAPVSAGNAKAKARKAPAPTPATPG